MTQTVLIVLVAIVLNICYPDGSPVAIFAVHNQCVCETFSPPTDDCADDATDH